MGDKLPISIVIITSGRNPREPLWNSQLLLSGRASHVLRVSPEEVLFSETSQAPNTVTEIYCPWGDRNQARQRGHDKAPTEFIYHVDDDVEPLSEDVLELALQEFDDPTVAVVSGPYENPKGLGYPGRVYNFLSNLWLTAGEADRNLFLAGHVLCRQNRFAWPADKTTGGEENLISKQLYESGQRIVYRADFKAKHHSLHTWRSLALRLWGHEKAKAPTAPSKLKKLGSIFRHCRTRNRGLQ